MIIVNLSPLECKDKKVGGIEPFPHLSKGFLLGINKLIQFHKHLISDDYYYFVIFTTIILCNIFLYPDFKATERFSNFLNICLYILHIIINIHLIGRTALSF